MTLRDWNGFAAQDKGELITKQLCLELLTMLHTIFVLLFSACFAFFRARLILMPLDCVCLVVVAFSSPA